MSRAKRWGWILGWLLLAWLGSSGPAEAGSAEWRQPEVVDSSVALEAPPAPPEGWITLEGEWLQVVADPRDRQTALRLARHGAQSLPAMAERLGVPTGPRVRLYLADEQERFMDLQPSQPPEWADGTAWPHRGLVFLRAPRARAGTATDLEIVLDHELVHVLLGRAFGDRAVPRWLQEGMARFLAGEYGPETTDELARGILGKGLIALDELASGFPRDPIRAQLAYAQSADLVAWIHGEFGPQVLPEIVQRMASGTPFGAAMYGATGRTVTELDRAWRSRLQSSPLWLRPLTSEGTWWALGGIILTVGWWSVQRRNRRKLARWRRDEELRDKLFEQLWQSRFVPPEPLGVPSVGRPGGDDTEVAR